MHLPPPLWQQAMREAFRQPIDLLNFLELSPHNFNLNAHPTFSFCCPKSYAHRIKKNDPNDPLLKQILPLDLENTQHLDFIDDPTGDHAAQTNAGVLQKYHGRALLIATSVCAIHCRYCFRQHFNYHESFHLNIAQKLQIINENIEEIILSGGDPLMLNDHKLNEIFQFVRAKKHIKRLRIHTRIPIVLPERITDAFLMLLKEFPLPKVMVIHCNHANEIDDEIKEILNKIAQTGTVLLNQSVLLKGVNDSAQTLIDLSERLFEAKVLPYYLHLLDKVAGAVHFDVSKQTALQLIEEMRKNLAGYLVPKLVEERAGFPYKIAINNDKDF
jgi:EF-P beta-lysylation protein EpmB